MSVPVITDGSPARWAARRRTGEERRLLGEVLVEAGLLSRGGLAAGLEAQRKGGGRLGVHLMHGGHVVPAAFHLFLGEHLESMRPDLVADLRAGAAAGRLPAPLAHHYGMVPVREADGVLELAVTTCDQPGLRRAVEALTGFVVEPTIAPPSLVAEALGAHYAAEIEPGVVFRPAGDNVLVLSDAARGLRAAGVGSLHPGASSGEWLRAIVAVALRDGARRIAIEPRDGAADIAFADRDGRHSRIAAPFGPYPGMAALIEGLARIAPRGRIVPRAGRFVVQSGGARLFVSVLALPGHGGRTYRLDLRSERACAPGSAALARSLPGLVEAVGECAARGRGLLGLAATSPSEWGTALEVVLDLLDDRLGRRAVIGAWDDRGAGPPDAAALAALRRGGGPDLVVVATPWGTGASGWIQDMARTRVVLAAVDAPDACCGAEVMARGAAGTGADGGPGGVVAVRHLETACGACRTPVDLGELLALLPGGSSAPAPAWSAPGCPGCRGSGDLEMARVAEFLPLAPGRLTRPGTRARVLREEQPGRPTMLRAAIRGALEGPVDAREVVRLLVHEPR